METPQQKTERLLNENITQISEVKNAIEKLYSKLEFLQLEIKTVIDNQAKINTNIDTVFSSTNKK